MGVVAVLAIAGLPSAEASIPIFEPRAPAVSSGGEPAPHVCFVTGRTRGPDGVERPVQGPPCTTQFAPLMVSVEDRLNVGTNFRGRAVSLSGPGIAGERACTKASPRGLTVPEALKRWSCKPPARPSGAGHLTVHVDDGQSLSAWQVDVVLLPRGFRATDRWRQVRFRLAGRHLRMQMLPNPDGSVPAGDALWDRGVKVICARPHARTARDTDVKRMRWPKDRLAASVLFERPFVRRPRWCLIEDRTGGDVAFVRFPKR